MLSPLFSQESSHFYSDQQPIHIVTQTDLEPDDWQYCIGTLLRVRDYFSDENDHLVDVESLKRNFQWDVLVTEWGCTKSKVEWFKDKILNAMREQDPQYANVLEIMFKNGALGLHAGSTVHAIEDGIKDSQKRIMSDIIQAEKGLRQSVPSTAQITAACDITAKRLLSASNNPNSSVTVDIISPPKDILTVLEMYIQKGGDLKNLPKVRMYGSFNINEVKKDPEIMSRLSALAEQGVDFCIYDRGASLGKAGYSKDITTNTNDQATVLFAQHLQTSTAPLVKLVRDAAIEWNKAIFYYKMFGTVEKVLSASSAGELVQVQFTNEFGSVENFARDFETIDLQAIAQRFICFFDQHFDREQLVENGNKDALKALQRLKQIENMAINPSQLCFADQLLLLPEDSFDTGSYIAISGNPEMGFQIQDSDSETPFVKCGKVGNAANAYSCLAGALFKKSEIENFLSALQNSPENSPQV